MLGTDEAVGVGRIELPTSCSQSGNELDPATEPSCPECQIGLTQTVPTADLARLAPQVDTASAAKTRELSKRLVEKALADLADIRWQEFLQIDQDNKLDNDLVPFIKQVLN